MGIKKNAALKTWVEINTAALRHNFLQFQNLIGPQCRFMAVVKSNAYGHGLTQVAKLLANSKFDPRVSSLGSREIRNSKFSAPRLWFGVDSMVEALRLREEGIQGPVLVLGSTLPLRMQEAAGKRITLTISNFESLAAFTKLRERPEFHIKIDTGMHRQGFLMPQIEKLIRFLGRSSLRPSGIYTHFAAAKDRTYPAFTLRQFGDFKKVLKVFEKSGFKNLVKHAAASGATILFPETHLDMVRVGMALWGHWPSDESRMNTESGQFGLPRIRLKPILSWKTRIAEIKNIPTGSSVGYDLTERVSRRSVIGILPVGYWHGFDRGLSSVGYVLVRGKRAKILGRVSMDMAVCDVTDIRDVRIEDIVTLIGRDGTEVITAEDISRLTATSPYEVLTRINPLIERIYRD